jgi:hypothetical protein
MGREGINLITNSESVIVEGAKEAIEDYKEGKLSREELYERILNLEVVYVDRQKFKDNGDLKNEDE